MTEKQEKILNSALKLFAEEGYSSVSTSRIAKEAGVSEGLIFRHFQSKEGLLNAILDSGGERGNQISENLASIGDSKKILSAMIEMPFSFPKSEHSYWRLIYALKWQRSQYAHNADAGIKQVAAEAFKEMGYKDPHNEAEVFMMLMDGMATHVLLKEETADPRKVVSILKKKYNL